MKNYFLIFIAFSICSCNIISNEDNCAEFHLKNELSSNVLLQVIQRIDSLHTFILDSFTITPNDIRTLHLDCSISPVDPYPTGDFAKFTFANNKSKIDTFKLTYSSSYYNSSDSINIYNRGLWIINTTTNNGNHILKTATYTISAKDSLEAN